MPRLTKLNQLGTLQRGKRGNFCLETLQWNALQLNCSQTACAWVDVCVSVHVFESHDPLRKSFNHRANLNKIRIRLKLRAQQVDASLSVSLFLALSLLLTHFSVCHSRLNSTSPLLPPFAKSHAQIWFNQFVYSAAFSMSASTMSTNENECQSECESLNLNSSGAGRGCTLFNTLMNLHKYII